MRSLRKRLTKRLDDTIRNIIRTKYGNRCCKCREKISGHNSHPAHIVAKGNGASWRRFDIENIILLCFKCHRWWHDNPTESGKWFANKYPEKENYLEKYRYGKTAEISTEEMETLLNKLKGMK
jgi:5-methylcytosine-specific restriction endonuclease McrA